jgi:translation initiation factor IF-2
MIAGSRKGMNAPLENFVKQENAKAAQAKSGAGALSEFKANADKAKVKGKRPTSVEEEEQKSGGKGASLSDMRRERKGRANRIVNIDDDDDSPRRGKSLVKKKQAGTISRKEKVILELPCTVRSFSEAAGVPAARVLRSLMTLGSMLNINAQLDADQAVMVATDLGLDLEFREPESVEDKMLSSYSEAEDKSEDLEPRPPVVTFLGHVDHGKTSLLDYLIGTKIVRGEAGGITQSIRAYQVQKDGHKVSFVDTPGHEAFTEMRARGANVTDIAVLVIAADDGIMPQTEEAISHALAAKVPIIVAANKIDLPGADINRVMTQMTEHGLTPGAWGGEVEVVGTSAITGQGMDELLETIQTIADINEYRANPKRPATGICLESEQASDRGVMAKAMVQNGTLRVGDVIVCGSSYGRIKALYDTLQPNKQMSEAGPSTPVNISGLETPPEAGERFYVMDDIVQAREIAESRANRYRKDSLSGSSTKVSFETFQELLQSGKLRQGDDKVTLNLIVRADTRGSLEAIEKELSKLEHPEVEIKILQKSVGGISVADVTLASASDAVVVGFNVIPDEQARILAESRQVEIRRYDIIYKLAEDIKAIVEGRLRPEEKVVELGRALVKQVFSVSRVGTIAGCYVAQGVIERGCRIRVNRDGRTIGDYALDTLRRVKDDVKEVPRGMECGIKLANFNDIKQDDVLEAYKIESVARKLD